MEAFEKGRAQGLPPQLVEYGIAAVFVSKKDKDRRLNTWKRRRKMACDPSNCQRMPIWQN